MGQKDNLYDEGDSSISDEAEKAEKEDLIVQLNDA